MSGSHVIHQATVAAQAFGASFALSPGEAARLAIIVEELAANLVDHGGVVAGDMVELGLQHHPEGTLITLIDPGKPFDPREAVIGSCPPDRGGGAGIALVRAWTTITDYRHEDGRNRLTLLLRAGPTG